MILVEVPGVEIRTDLGLEESPDEQVVQKTVVLVGNRRGHHRPDSATKDLFRFQQRHGFAAHNNRGRKVRTGGQ